MAVFHRVLRRANEEDRGLGLGRGGDRELIIKCFFFLSSWFFNVLKSA